MALADWAVIDENEIVKEIVSIDILDMSTPSPTADKIGWSMIKIMNETPEIGMIWDGENFKFN